MDIAQYVYMTFDNPEDVIKFLIGFPKIIEMENALKPILAEAAHLMDLEKKGELGGINLDALSLEEVRDLYKKMTNKSGDH